MSRARGLALYVHAIAWERFSYYGVCALLIGDVLVESPSDALALLAGFTALNYAFAVLGGALAQRWIGELRALQLGGALMAAGHVVLALSHGTGPHLGLALLCVGDGLLRTTVAGNLGALYRDGDPRRGRAYHLLYAGVNVGALAASLVAALDWQVGFALGGVGLLVTVWTLDRGRAQLRLRERPLGRMATLSLALALAAMIVVARALLLRPQLCAATLVLAAVIVVATLTTMAIRERGPSRTRLLALLVLMMFHAALWTGLELIGGSLFTLAGSFADRSALGSTMSVSAIVAIIVLAPLVPWLWARLGRVGLEPATPTKFAIGLLLVALAFLALGLGSEWGLPRGSVASSALFVCLALMTLAELCVSPLGLATAAELSPRRAIGLCMGGWYLTYAIGHLLGAQLREATAISSASAAAVLERCCDVSTRTGLAVITLAIGLVLLGRWLGASPTSGRAATGSA